MMDRNIWRGGETLWREFSPEQDPDQEERYSKEQYRISFKDFFKDQIERSENLDKKFFDGFAQRGSDPILWIKDFKNQAGIRTWGEVISTLGDIFPRISNFGARYSHEQMGRPNSRIWTRAERLEPNGRNLVEAITRNPMGRSHWQTAFRILKACGLLRQDCVSFAEWIEQKGIAEKLNFCTEDFFKKALRFKSPSRAMGKERILASLI